MDILGRIFVIVITIILITLFPLQYIAQLQSETIDDVVNQYSSEFTETARNEGCITKDMYEDYIHKFDATGELYDIEIEVAHPVSGKEIEKASIGDKLPDKTMEKVSYKQKNSDKQIQSFATHTHTGDCYVTCNGIDYNGDGVINQWDCIEAPNGSMETNYTCRKCGSIAYKIVGSPVGSTTYYFGHTNGTSPICSTVVIFITPVQPTQTVIVENSMDSTAIATYLDGHTGTVNCKTTGFNSNNLGNQTVTLTYTGLVGNANTTGTRTCIVQVNVVLPRYLTSITVQPSTQTVTRYTNPSFTVTAFYSDNTSSVVSNYSVSGFDNTKLGTQNVTISYTNGTITKYASAQVTVVLPSKYLIDISVLPVNQTVLRYTNPSYTVEAYYYDTLNYTSSYVTDYTISGFDNSKLGTQSVTISYTYGNTTMTSSVNVTVIPPKTLSYIVVTPTTQTIMKNTQPTFTVIAHFSDGSSNQVYDYVVYGLDNTKVGTQEVIVFYTYEGNFNGVPATVIVKDPKILTGLTVTPDSQDIQRYTNPHFLVTAYYSDGTSGQVYDYTVSGFDNKRLGTQNVTISYTYEGITMTITPQVTVNKLLMQCQKCGTMYELNEEDVDQGCPVCKSTLVSIEATPDILTVTKGDSLPITVFGTYANGYKQTVSEWSSNYNSNILGRQEVTVIYQGFTTYITVYVTNTSKSCPICGTVYQLEEDGSDGGCPSCSTIADSIIVSPQSVIINKHQALPITVIATYRDGHTATVSDWTTDLIPDTAGVFQATIFYHEVSTRITVEVNDEDSITCPICGLKYKFSESPDGCPVCYHMVIGIEARLRSGGTKIQYKSNLNLEIILKFRDGHKEASYTGWTVDGYQSEVLGTQTITVHYAEHSTQLTIEVVNALPKSVCPNGHTYYLNEDGSNPGCPICDVSSDKSNAIFYFDITYTSIIIDTIYKDGFYSLKNGDYLTIRVKPREKSPIHNIRSMFSWLLFLITDKEYSFGGEVVL